MQKVFLDCGFHLGEGLTQFSKHLNIDSSWIVYSFEPNPNCKIEEIVKQFPFNVNYFNKAVWVEDKELTFNVVGEDKLSTGSNVDELSAFGLGIVRDKVKVQAIDLSKFIEELKDKEIYCKLDIEGAEFPVLRKLIDTGAIKFIKKLWVEFHPLNMPGWDMWGLKKEVCQYTSLADWN